MCCLLVCVAPLLATASGVECCSLLLADARLRVERCAKGKWCTRIGASSKMCVGADLGASFAPTVACRKWGKLR